MSKNFSFCLLIALIAIMVIFSHRSIISQRNNISNTNAFQILERINRISRFKNKYQENKENKKSSENKLYSRNTVMNSVLSTVNPQHNYPIGHLYIDINATNYAYCTASKINTANRNIELTAMYCLVDEYGTPYKSDTLTFSPDKHDYALLRFEFEDPTGGNVRLQDYTGALGWRFNIQNNTPTNVFCYSKRGDLEGCPNDSEHLCEWQGIVEIDDKYNFINDVDLGIGASGGPFIYQYDRNTTLGYVYTVFAEYTNYSEAHTSNGFSEAQI
ncbi:serine protease [Gigaspora margarita]|uniref:Serine protease n=1 Tax=Gigaspora margarita TaxID=4874 RepID=A0A8H4ASL7_GIGMA|nr:serine protease [Gigaspora margarita]